MADLIRNPNCLFSQANAQLIVIKVKVLELLQAAEIHISVHI